MGTVSSDPVDTHQADRVENPPLGGIDETDDVPDIPIPVAEFPDDISLKDPGEAYALEELRIQQSPVREGTRRGSGSSGPLSPKVVIKTSTHTVV